MFGHSEKEKSHAPTKTTPKEQYFTYLFIFKCQLLSVLKIKVNSNLLQLLFFLVENLLQLLKCFTHKNCPRLKTKKQRIFSSPIIKNKKIIFCVPFVFIVCLSPQMSVYLKHSVRLVSEISFFSWKLWRYSEELILARFETLNSRYSVSFLFLCLLSNSNAKTHFFNF